MNESALCAEVAARPGVPRATADALVSARVPPIAEALARNETVAIAGCGAFSPRSRPARQGRNPAPGESIAVAASGTPGPSRRFSARDEAGEEDR